MFIEFLKLEELKALNNEELIKYTNNLDVLCTHINKLGTACLLLLVDRKTAIEKDITKAIKNNEDAELNYKAFAQTKIH